MAKVLIQKVSLQTVNGHAEKPCIQLRPSHIRLLSKKLVTKPKKRQKIVPSTAKGSCLLNLNRPLHNKKSSRVLIRILTRPYNSITAEGHTNDDSALFFSRLPLACCTLNSHPSRPQGTPRKPSNSEPHRVSNLSCLAVCWTKRVLSQKR